MHSSTKSLIDIVETSKLLSDETRVKILLALKESGGMCVYEIAEVVGASHSATSHQLAKLEARDVVVCYREGQKMCYEFATTEIARDIESMLSLLT